MEYGTILQIVLVAVITILKQTRSQNVPDSPCPNVFKYERDQSGFHGIVIVPNPLPFLAIDLTVSLYVTDQMSSNSNVNLSLVDSNAWQNLAAGDRRPVLYRLDFQNSSSLPTIKEIIVNEEFICSGAKPSSTAKTLNLQHSIFNDRCSTGSLQCSFNIQGSGGKPASTNNQHSQPPPTQITHKGCGRIAIPPAPLITYGHDTVRGQFPWHAAIYRSEAINLQYICGGSLIGSRTILTAGHCVTKRTVDYPQNPDLFLVYLGKYHLKQWSEGGVQDKQVVEILLHPKYNGSNLQSDLAIMILSSNVEYTIYVRPVCLWSKSEIDLSNVIGKEGIIPGWGFDETQQITEDLKVSIMPVVSQDTCHWSNTDFFPRFTSNMTFCAGFVNGSSVCNGDSGGGMVFPQKQTDNSVVWMLRGIVSVSKAKDNQPICDPNNYVVFTDAAKYLDWIISVTDTDRRSK